MATNMEDEMVPNVDEQAYNPEQPPTYDAAFPALTTEPRALDPALVTSGAWQPKFQSRSSKCTQVSGALCGTWCKHSLFISCCSLKLHVCYLDVQLLFF